MPNLDQDKLQNFLEAMVASGSHPSPSLMRVIAKVFKEPVETVENLCLEFFDHKEASEPAPQKQDLNG